MEVTDSGDGSALGAMNNFTGVFLALALIAVSIGIIITIVGVVAYKSGVIQQSKFEPWKILAGLWGAVLLVSMPSLIYYGSTLMPPPAATNAQIVTPAYEGFTETKVEFADTKDEAEIEQILGSENFEAAKEAMKGERVNSWDSPDSWYSYDKMLIYRTGSDGKVDPCMKVRLFYMKKGTTSGSFGSAKTLDYTHPDYSESKCGGPVEEYSNPDNPQ